MKKLILISALAFNCVAEEETSKFYMCDVYQEMATSVMSGRQENVPMSAMIKIAADNKVLANIVEMAYDRPSYSVFANKQEAIAEFTNEVYMACYKELSAK